MISRASGSFLGSGLLLLALVMIFASPPSSTRGSAPPGDPAHGEELFGTMGCNGCHQISGVGGQVGPDLTGVFKLDLAKDRPGQRHANIADYVRESLENPQAYIVPGFPDPSPMPSAELFQLSPQDVDDLIAYLEKAAKSADSP